MFKLNFFFLILAGWWCSGKEERLRYDGLGFEAWFDLRLRFSFFFIETVSITGKKWQRPFTKGTTAAAKMREARAN